ncbi:MAG: hypothetical protein ACLT98_15755 [Eggerthellaceae bacterium]
MDAHAPFFLREQDRLFFASLADDREAETAGEKTRLHRIIQQSDLNVWV